MMMMMMMEKNQPQELSYNKNSKKMLDTNHAFFAIGCPAYKFYYLFVFLYFTYFVYLIYLVYFIS